MIFGAGLIFGADIIFGTEIISGFNYAWTNVVTTGGTVTTTDPTLQDFTITPT